MAKKDTLGSMSDKIMKIQKKISSKTQLNKKSIESLSKDLKQVSGSLRDIQEDLEKNELSIALMKSKMTAIEDSLKQCKAPAPVFEEEESINDEIALSSIETNHDAPKIHTKSLKKNQQTSNFSKSRITTPIDRLLKLVYHFKSVDLKRASKALAQDPSVIEDWAQILERKGLIKLEYPPIGTMRMIKPQGSKLKPSPEFKIKKKVKHKHEKTKHEKK